MEPDEKRARVATEPDVALVCFQEELVHTRRHKLVEVSTVFATMLNGEWVESASDTVRVAFDSGVVKTFIEQISPFPPELDFDCDDDGDFHGGYGVGHHDYGGGHGVKGLCEMAHYYDVQPLARKLQKFLLEIKQTLTTVKSLYELAVAFDYHDLKLKCVESVTNDPPYFLLFAWGEDHETAFMTKNLELLSYSDFQPAWQTLVELTGEYTCSHGQAEDPDYPYTIHAPYNKGEKYIAPPVEALRLMVPFMFKCFGHHEKYSQLPDGWSVKVSRKRGSVGEKYYFHKQTNKTMLTRPQYV